MITNIFSLSTTFIKALIIFSSNRPSNLIVFLFFPQEPYFFWAFGVHEEDCYGAIHVPSGKAYLFVPKVPADYLVWIGSFPSLEGFKQKYLVDEVYYTNQVGDFPFLIF